MLKNVQLNNLIFYWKTDIICNKTLCKNITDRRRSDEERQNRLDKWLDCDHARKYIHIDQQRYNYCQKCDYHGFKLDTKTSALSS